MSAVRLACLGCLLAAFACQSSTSASGGSAPPPTTPSALVGAPASLPDNAAAQPDVSEGDVTARAPVSAITVAEARKTKPNAQLVVKGTYLGWRGPCTGVPPTRSAWQLADSSDQGSACVYVDGPQPEGAQPNDPPASLRVTVRGVRRDYDSLPYIQATSVQRDQP